MRGGSASAFALLIACGRTPIEVDIPSDAEVSDRSVEDAGNEKADDAPTPRVTTTLASQQSDPCWLVLDEGSVYWTNCAANTIVKCPKTGGPMTTLVSGRHPGGFVLDATSLYWIDVGQYSNATYTFDGRLVKCPSSGCGNTSMTLSKTNMQTSGLIAGDLGSLYFFAESPETLSRCDKTGCLAGSTLIATSTHAVGVVVHGDRLFWTERSNSTIATCPTSGCAKTTLFATGQSYPTGIAVDDSNVYWTNQDMSGSVMKCPLAGGKPTALANGQSFPTDVATDGTNVYWTNQYDGTVMKCSVNGCATPEVLVSGQSYPNQIAVDDESVYWTTTGANAYVGTIMKVTPK